MTITDVLKYLVDEAKVAKDPGDYDDLVTGIAVLLPKRLYAQLEQLVYGPIHDGDAICPTERNFLMAIGLAIKVCYKGDSSYNGATTTAHSVNKKITERTKEVE